MNREAFVLTLIEEGFPEPVIVTREPGAMEEHAHSFEAKALIISGEIVIRIGSDEQFFTTGDIFRVPPNVLHAERYGPNGVQYLVGRKFAQS
jgi:quercetin dioxygenase-like cupin family protein